MPNEDDLAKPATPRSIEKGSQDFLSKNRAPKEIESDWNDWIQQGGTAVWDLSLIHI